MNQKTIILMICTCEKSQVQIMKSFDEFKKLNESSALELEFIQKDVNLISNIQTNQRMGKKLIVASLVNEKLLGEEEINRTLVGTGVEIHLLQTHKPNSYESHLDLMGVDIIVVTKVTEEEQLSAKEIFMHFLHSLNQLPKRCFKPQLVMEDYVRV